MNNPSHTRKPAIAAALTVFLVIATALLLRFFFAAPDLPTHATVFPTPAPLADFVLMDQDGAQFDNETLKGHWSMVFFGFTHCPDICPVTLQKLVMARRRLAGADPQATLPEIVFISVDPGRDTPETLGQYVRSFGEDVRGLRGEPAELSRLTRTLGAYFSVQTDGGEAYSVAHSAAVFVINENAEYHAIFSTPHEIEAFARDMSLIIALR